MATIGLVPEGMLTSTLYELFGIARALEKRGHRPHFFTLADHEPAIRAQGWDFTPLFPELYPPGWLARTDAEDERTNPFVLQARIRERFRARFAALREGAFQRACERTRPDLFLVSEDAPWLGLAAHGTGVPTVMFSRLPSSKDALAPPIGSDIIPGTPWSGLRTRVAWKKVAFANGARELLVGLNAEVARLARLCGFPVERIDFTGENAPRLGLPTLVACPEFFDLPRAHRRPEDVYVEPLVDPERKLNETFPWERLAPGKPILYCAVGLTSMTFHPHRARGLIESFLAAMAERPQWQGVVALTERLPASELKCPPNVVALPRIPQMELLERSALFVTQAGGISVMEALTYGVPMVAVPLFYDHFGYAARIAYHRLGTLCPAAQVGELGRHLDEVMKDAGYAERAREAARKLEALRERGAAVDFVERHLPASVRAGAA